MSKKQRRQGQKKDQQPKRPLKLPLPAATGRTVTNHLTSCSNPGLVYERYIKYLHTSNDWSLTPNTRAGEENPKQKAIGATITAQRNLSNFQPLWQDFLERWERTVKYFNANPFPLKTDWRFVTGLGRGGPLEVGFTFHRIYGFPVIPGSGLKGLARMWSLMQVAEKLGVPAKLWRDLENVLLAEDSGENKVQQKALAELCKSLDLPDDAPIRQQGLIAAGDWPGQFRLIFGTTKQSGRTIFFDAIPTEPPILELDVMTPHFSQYYQGNNAPPADWDYPKPIPFLTVGKDTSFCFAVGWRGKEDKKAQQQAIDWLEEGLQELGAGAKTAAGYGYFRSDLLEEA